MYEVKLIVFCKSGIAREGMSAKLKEEEFLLLMQTLEEVGGPNLKNLRLPIEPTVTEFIVGGEIERVGVVFMELKDENTDNDRTPETR